MSDDYREFEVWKRAVLQRAVEAKKAATKIAYEGMKEDMEAVIRKLRPLSLSRERRKWRSEALWFVLRKMYRYVRLYDLLPSEGELSYWGFDFVLLESARPRVCPVSGC